MTMGSESAQSLVPVGYVELPPGLKQNIFAARVARRVDYKPNYKKSSKITTTKEIAMRCKELTWKVGKHLGPLLMVFGIIFCICIQDSSVAKKGNHTVDHPHNQIQEQPTQNRRSSFEAVDENSSLIRKNRKMEKRQLKERDKRTKNIRFVVGTAITLATLVAAIPPIVMAAIKAKTKPPAGSLTQLSGKQGCIDLTANQTKTSCTQRKHHLGEPRSTIVSPDGKYLYLVETNGIDVFTRDETGDLQETLCMSFSGNSQGCSPALSDYGVGFKQLKFSSDGSHAYLVSQPASNQIIDVLEYQPSNGLFQEQGIVTTYYNRALSYVQDLFITAENMYAVSNDLSTGGGIAVFSFNTQYRPQQLNGKAGCITVNGMDGHGSQTCTTNPQVEGARTVAVPPDGYALYLGTQPSPRSGKIVTFVKNQSTGELTYITCTSTPVTQGCETARGLRGLNTIFTETPKIKIPHQNSDRQLYAISESPGTISLFAFDTIVPVQYLHRAGCISSGFFELSDPCHPGLAISALNNGLIAPNLQTVYTISNEDSSIAVFARTNGTKDQYRGELTQLSDPYGCITAESKLQNQCKTANGIEEPIDLVISPDSKNLYTLTKNTIAAFKVQS